MEKKKNTPIIIVVIVAIIAVAGIVLFLLNNKVTVKFDADNGTSPYVIKIKKGELIDKIEDPIKDGYIFVEWNDGTEKFNFQHPVYENINLKAVYKKVYTVKFVDGDKELATIQVEEGDTLTSKSSLPIPASRDGLAFMGWTLDGKMYDTSAPVTSDLKLVSGWEEYRPATEITADNTLTIEINKVGKINYSVSPSNTTDEIIFKSADEKIATVDKTGNVTALAVGETKITISAGEAKVEVKIIVKPAPVLATSVVFDEIGTLVARDKTKTLKVTVLPENTDDKTVTFTTSDDKIATVDKDGNVKGIKKGECTITAITANGKTATCKVTVFVPVASITLLIDGAETSKTISYDANTYANLVAYVYPTDADISTVTWNCPDASGINASYSLSIDSANKNKGTLYAKSTASYNSPLNVNCYITNQDGQKIESNTVKIYAEKKLTIENRVSTGALQYSGGNYVGYYKHQDNIELVTNNDVTFSYDTNSDYIAQEHVESKELWLTLWNDHSHQEGFQIQVTSAGGQKLTVIINISNK